MTVNINIKYDFLGAIETIDDFFSDLEWVGGQKKL